MLFPGSIQANAFCPVEGTPFPHKDPGTFCVNSGRKSEGLLGAAKGSAPLNGKLVAASFSYLRLETLVFSEFRKHRKEPGGLLVLPEEQSVNVYVRMKVLVALKQQKMDRGSLLSVQVL